MLTCREILDFLMDYVNGELLLAQRLKFDLHLSLCPPCRAYLASYRQTVELEKGLQKSDIPPVPEDLVKAILEARKPDSES